MKCCRLSLFKYFCISINKLRTGKYLSDDVHIEKILKQGNTLLPLIFEFALEYVIGKTLENQVRLKLNGTHHFLDYVDDVNQLRDKIHTMNNNRKHIDAKKFSLDGKSRKKREKFKTLR
jgi:uncharacterized protein YdcH (DUF465 family)